MTDSSQSDEQDLALAQQIVSLGSFIHRWGINRSHELEDYDLSFSQVSVLYNVRHGVENPGTIARLLMVTPKAITNLVDSLVARELLVREPDTQDRRKIRLRVTERGFAISRAFETESLEPLAKAITSLSAEDRAVLAEYREVVERVVRQIGYRTGLDEAPPTS